MKKVLLCICVVFTLIFIFGHSLMNQEVSHKESTTVQKELVEPVHKAITGTELIHFSVRDVAHIFEFAVLGVELLLLFRGKRMAFQGLRALSYCGLTALIDESVQYLSGRAPQVVDIWYDIIGSAIGVFIGVLAILVVNSLRKPKEQKG